MLNIKIHSQPDDESCGPTCLHAIYRYYGLQMSLKDMIKTIERSASGGTLAPLLGKHALQNGFNARIYINNLDVFDPMWFRLGEAKNEELIARLTSQLKYKDDKGLVQESIAYMQYLQLGGKVCFRPLNPNLFKWYFKQNIPILTGLSATYLYNSPREIFTDEGRSVYDDIAGTPCGHFVILCGYDEHKKYVVIADPHRENPLTHDNYYKVHIARLINAIMLGVLTYDGNLLIIQPPSPTLIEEPTRWQTLRIAPTPI